MSGTYGYADRLRETYLNYLRAAHPIHPSQTELREQFEREVARPERFAREPLISTIPAYRPAEAPRDLFDREASPRLTPRMHELSDAFDPDRPLYAHQRRALEAIQRGRDTVVATGTGSGKTEAFLLPIFDDLFRDPSPGVRALLVYPMNALANDQLERLRELVGDSPITFGRYTGQTPWANDDVRPEDADRIHRNERFTRQSIRTDPPHILITNFAMLEYLLLRPGDHTLIGDPLRYVVLDEAHSYSGAQGIDIGLLMRRLRQRIGRPPRFILTSATLGDGSDLQREEIADFASRLTGGAFVAGDVIYGEEQSPFPSHALKSIDLPRLINAGPEMAEAGSAAAIRDAETTRRWLDRLGLSAPPDGDQPSELLYHSLRGCEAARQVYDHLRREPKTASELCNEIYGTDDQQAVAGLYGLLVAIGEAKDRDGRPLMPVRVHHFFRGLTGASLELDPGEQSDRPPVARLYLEDRRRGENERRLVELRSCVHCGLPVAMIRLRSGGLWEKPIRKLDGDADGALRLLTWLDPRQLNEGEEGEDVEANAEGNLRSVALDPVEGRYFEQPDEQLSDNPQGVRLHLITRHLDGGDLKVCPCCGGEARPFRSVLRAFSTGDDAPTAVLAEEMVRLAPKGDEAGQAAPEQLPAQGRRLLAFSDSRQRAAHFTSYLTWTSAEPAFVHPVLRAANHFESRPAGGGSVPEVIERALRDLDGEPWVVVREQNQDGFERYDVKESADLNPTQRRRLEEELALSVYRHLAASPRQRTKLRGLRLLAPAIEIERSKWNGARQAAPALFDDLKLGQNVVQRLLVYMLQRRALLFYPENLTVNRLLPNGRGPHRVAFHRNPTTQKNSSTSLVRWNPYHAPTTSRKQAVRLSRTREIVRHGLIAAGQDPSEMAISDALEGLWVWLTRESRILRDAGGGAYQLPAERLLLRVGAEWHRCRRCGAPTIFPVGGVCEIFGCDGLLERIDGHTGPDRRHVDRYIRPPMPMVVREHTAQLDLDQGRQYQQRFMAGEVNVLSSSTTFELGVDVGSLQSVLLRNVPPTAANYVQRAGRAGRRRQGLAHAVSYARTIPHDQHHYFEPRQIVAGHVPVPVVYTANRPLTQRHANSLLLARFLHEQCPELANKTSIAIGSFFHATDSESAAALPVHRYAPWCRENIDRLAGEIRDIIPDDCKLEPQDAVEHSIKMMSDAHAKGLRAPLDSLGREDQELLQTQRGAIEGSRGIGRLGKLDQARKSIQRLREQLLHTRLISFLARYAFLPNYTFPQDTLALRVRQPSHTERMDLTRDRERGISEYAPGSEIIADGKLFRSVGVNLEKREPDLRWFTLDRQARRVWIERRKDRLPRGKDQPCQFLEPSGFTTDYDAPVEPPNLFRLRPPPNTQVFLREGADHFEPCRDLPGVETGRRNDATLFRANLGSGRGFRLCGRCGREALGRRAGRSHTTPWGSPCKGRFEWVALVHQQKADVLQVRFSDDAPPVGDRPFWASLAAAMHRAACLRLAIDPGDLETSYRSQREEDPEGELLFYDTIPGGAGHIERIRDRLPKVLGAAQVLAERCPNHDCDPESSCYSCLRTYGNQFEWEDLRRAAILEQLSGLTASGAAPSRSNSKATSARSEGA